MFITGEVTKPGPYPLSGPRTVMQLIAVAGGLLEYADKDNIVVLRTTTVSRKATSSDIGRVAGQGAWSRTSSFSLATRWWCPSMTARVLLVFVVATCVPAVSGAQVLERPQRERAPRTESTRQVTLSATTLGSYDDNLAAEQTLSSSEIPAQAGYTGYADGTLQFGQAKGSRLFDASARGYVNSFRNVGLTPKYGADAQVHFATGTKHRFQVWQGVRNEPFYNIGGFSVFRDVADFTAVA